VVGNTISKSLFLLIFYTKESSPRHFIISPKNGRDLLMCVKIVEKVDKMKNKGQDVLRKSS